MPKMGFAQVSIFIDSQYFRLPETSTNKKIIPTMLMRYFTAIMMLILAALFIRNLLNRRQQRVLTEWVSLVAKVMIAVSLIALVMRWFQAA